jgi:hypothetical protein
VELFQCALRTRNLVPLFRNERILFLIGLDPLEIFDSLTAHPLLVMSSGISMMEYPPSAASNRRYYEDIRKKIPDAVCTAAANLDTVDFAGRIFLKNAAMNIAAGAMAPGINTLFNKFKAVPAVIVSAGPSLDKNIGLLKAARSKCLILATDTSFKILLGNKIKPDFVFTSDYKEISRLHFENLKIDDVPLVFDLEAAPASLAAYRSMRFVAASNKPLPFLINTFTGDKGFVPKGMSVAHFTFSAAKAFGCDPIIFIGQDLSYTDGFSHAQGTPSRQKIALADSKGEQLVRVKSLLTGKDVLTNAPMYIYLRHFESIIARSKRKCINATEGGSGIKGAAAMVLKDAIRKYCIKNIKAAEIIRRARLSAPAPDIRLIIKKVQDLMRSLEEVGKASSTIIEILEKVFKLSQKPNPDISEISRHLFRLKAPAAKVMSAEPVLLIIHADLLEQMMQQRREGKFDPGCMKDAAVKNMEADFKDDYGFQKAVYAGATFLKGCLAKSISDLKKIA